MSEQPTIDPGADESSTPVSKLPLLIVGAATSLAVLVIIALVAFRGPVEYDPGSPEAALQSFLQAGFDDREESTLLAMLTPEARAECEADADKRGYGWSSWDGDGLRAELDTIRVDDETAVATVSFRHGNSTDPFNSYSYSFSNKYTLLRIDDQWLIDRAGWPYSFSVCTTKNR